MSNFNEFKKDVNIQFSLPALMTSFDYGASMTAKKKWMPDK